jgi:Transposase IS66 family
MADHVGACAATLMPIYALIKAHVLAAQRIHGDDTTVPVLAKVKTRTERIWTYVRDDRPFGGADPPAAVFFYSPDRAGIHPERHLAGYAGILQADAYAGAILAPDIVSAILTGKHPPELTARRLMDDTRVPLDWNDQRRRLGFASAH